MSQFISVKIDLGKCVGISQCGQCVAVCPVSIFDRQKNNPVIVEKEQDECTLCELCLDACEPHAILIQKLYEN
jgi:NAD-dependent dihydropyrimidine dehydrogenase PreA subunit